MCVRDCVGGERETAIEREGGREGESVVERMLTGNVWQSKEQKERAAGARQQRVNPLIPESVTGERGRRRR